MVKVNENKIFHMKRFFAVTIVSFFMLSLGAIAQEHPKEHPSEHPSSKKPMVTKDALADAIAGYVNDDAKLKGGFFMVYDKVQNKPLALTLEKVHRDRLARLGEGQYFACADFNCTDGSVYDIDVFMKDSPKGLQATDVSVHKKNGEARYGWVEKDGVWMKSKQ